MFGMASGNIVVVIALSTAATPSCPDDLDTKSRRLINGKT